MDYLVFWGDEVILLVVLLQEDDDVWQDDHDDLNGPASALLKRSDAFEHETAGRRQDVRLFELPAIVHNRGLWVDAMVDL